jgi:immunity protein 42 of polymorphic toxin system
MIVGDPNTFAIESEISVAYERLSQLALGFFALHVGGRCYGVRDWDATMLACSLDGVDVRIKDRGAHAAGAIADGAAEVVAKAFSRAIYMEHDPNEIFFGMQSHTFSDLIHSSKIMWAPDGDEAFDDSSYVLQFDIERDVRLIAFSRASDDCLDVGSLRDVWLPQEDFYRILQQWHEAFVAEWTSLAKADGTIPLIQ